jgi:hypothetical protein
MSRPSDFDGIGFASRIPQRRRQFRTNVRGEGGIMSRIPGVEPENASPGVRAIYDKFEAADFQILNVTKMFANNEHFLAGMYALASGLYFHGKLSPRYRELAYLRASQLNSCHY